jgi:hypothetical protein
MALATTNLSLNDIHVAIGGTTLTTVSLNDTDVRAVETWDSTYAGAEGISQVTATTIDIGEFRNTSLLVDTTVVTRGSDSAADKFGNYYEYGYRSGSYGSRNPTTIQVAIAGTNYNISELYSDRYIPFSGNSSGFMYLTLTDSGSTLSQNSFLHLVSSRLSAPLATSDATFFSNGSISRWAWIIGSSTAAIAFGSTNGSFTTISTYG